MLTQNDLDMFIGDLERWRHGPLFRNFIYTPGVKFLCEKGGKGDSSAWWLLDAICSHQRNPALLANEDARYMQFWKLTVSGSEAILTCDDGNGNILITQKIPYTDFCLPEVKVWVGPDNGDGTRTVYLPSEH